MSVTGDDATSNMKKNPPSSGASSFRFSSSKQYEGLLLPPVISFSMRARSTSISARKTAVCSLSCAMRCRLYAASARCWAATVTWDWARVSVGEMCNEVHGEILEKGIFSYQSTNTANNVSINKKKIKHISMVRIQV